MCVERQGTVDVCRIQTALPKLKHSVEHAMSHTSAWNAPVMNSVVVKGERLHCMLTQFLAGASPDIVAHAGGGEGLDAGRLRPGG